jgi:hypothetical protein
VNRESIKSYFERIAPVWDYWHARNRYYHRTIRRLVEGMVPPGSQVLELGAGTGDGLAALRPARGIGLNPAEGLTSRAREKHPELEFHTVEVDDVRTSAGFQPDYVIMTNLLDYVYDVWDLLESLKASVSESTLLVITTSNPVWAPIIRLASRLGLRVPESPRNFITNRDIRSVLELQGYSVVEEGMALPVPMRIPLLGTLLNVIVPELPIVRYFSSIQYLVARPSTPRPPLSCSVIVPCHNEEGNIEQCARRVPDMGTWTEVVFVDDGSTDGTREQVRRVMQDDPRVRLITFDKNRGKANAVRAGFEAARGDVLVILDADMAVMPEELPKFLKPLQEGRADFINGTRLVYAMEGRAMKVSNFFGNKGFCYLVSWVLRQRVSDTLCGTKVMFKKDFMRMPIGGKERWGDFDLLFGASRLKLRILEIPVHYQERRAGASKMRAMFEVWFFLRSCLEGWRSLRFPHRFPWQVDRDAVEGWRELGPTAPERAS